MRKSLSIVLVLIVAAAFIVVSIFTVRAVRERNSESVFIENLHALQDGEGVFKSLGTM